MRLPRPARRRSRRERASGCRSAGSPCRRSRSSRARARSRRGTCGDRALPGTLALGGDEPPADFSAAPSATHSVDCAGVLGEGHGGDGRPGHGDGERDHATTIAGDGSFNFMSNLSAWGKQHTWGHTQVHIGCNTAGEPMERRAGRPDVVIKVREHGPYKVTGPVTLTDARELRCRCRTGRSSSAAAGAHGRSPIATARTAARRDRLSCGLPPARQGDPLFPSPVFGGLPLSGDTPEEGAPFYGRYSNPTWEGWESAVGSSRAATSSHSPPAWPRSPPCSDDSAGRRRARGPDRRLLHRPHARDRHLEPRGVEVRLVPTRRGDPRRVARCVAGLDRVPVESVARRRRHRALAAAAHDAGALVAVDNTLATPLRQRPLELGADLAVASATKQLAGTATCCSATWRRVSRRGWTTCAPGAPDRGDSRPVRDLARAPLAGDAGGPRRPPGGDDG